MSYTNRKNEYERLLSLKREIPQNLKDEFSLDLPQMEEQPKTLKKKKRGRK